MKVISMAEATNDGTKRSPEDCLKDCLNDVGVAGALENGKKVLVLALDESDGNYGVSWYQAGMTCSQMIALCEVAKTIFLTDMNYIPRGD
jgi:hypothetical protein